MATPEAFEQNPSLVYRFYNARRAQLQQDDVNPNAAHEALAKLEKAFGSNLMLVTQNVDDLHDAVEASLFIICMASCYRRAAL